MRVSVKPEDQERYRRVFKTRVKVTDIPLFTPVGHCCVSTKLYKFLIDCLVYFKIERQHLSM